MSSLTPQTFKENFIYILIKIWNRKSHSDLDLGPNTPSQWSVCISFLSIKQNVFIYLNTLKKILRNSNPIWYNLIKIS